MSILLVFSWLVAVLLLQQEPCFAAQSSTPDSTPKRGRPPTPVIPRRRSSHFKIPSLPLSVLVSSLSSNQSELNTTAGDEDSAELESRDAAADAALSDSNGAATSETTPASRGSTSIPRRKAVTTKSNFSDEERTSTHVSKKKAASPLTASSTDEGTAEQHSQEQQTAETQPGGLLSFLGELSPVSSDAASKSSSPSRRHPIIEIATALTQFTLPWLQQGRSESTSAVNERGRGEPGMDDRSESNFASINDEESEGTASKGSPITTSGDGDVSATDETVSSQVPREGAEGGSESASPDAEVDRKSLQDPQACGVATALSPEQTLRTIVFLGRMCKSLPMPAKKQCAGTLDQALLYISGQMFTFLNSFSRFLREQRQRGGDTPDFNALLHDVARIYQSTLVIHETGVSDDQPQAALVFLESMTRIINLVLSHPLFLKDKQLLKGQELAVMCAAAAQQLTLEQVMACLLQVSLGLEELRRLMEKAEASSQGCAGRTRRSIASPEIVEGRPWSITSSPTTKSRRGSFPLLSKWLHRRSKGVDEREDEDR